MSMLFAAVRISVLSFCSFFVLCSDSLAQDFRQVHPGVEHAVVEKEISGLKVRMNLLRLDLAKVRLDVVHAMDGAIGTEKTSSIATRHGAIAGINAGFFKLDSTITAGDTAGVLMIDGVLLSESLNSRSALLINNRGTKTAVEMGQLDIWTNLLAGKYVYRVSGINRARKDNEAVLYTPEFGHSTLTVPGGVEYVIKHGRIFKIDIGGGSSRIPSDGFVISAGKDWKDDPFKRLAVGRRVRLETKRGQAHTVNDFPAEDITNGVSRLVVNGKIELTWEQEKSSRAFSETRHPRTAVAKLKDGKFLMITADGRSESSGGISLQDLAEYLLSIGAVEAMNLDGGGSTTMYLNGKVVNAPSDKEGERKIGDAIVVTLRKR